MADPTFGDPRDAANADQDAVDVEEILLHQHRGERKRNNKKKKNVIMIIISYLLLK